MRGEPATVPAVKPAGARGEYGAIPMANLDKDAARALVDAGYMPIGEYVRLFGAEYADEVASPGTVPDHPSVREIAETVIHH